MVKPLRHALQLLTQIPAAPEGRADPVDVGRSVVAYPAVGLLLGLIVAAVAVLLPPAEPLTVAVALLVLWVGLTGILHLDGLADSADALFGGHGDPERTDAILKDPQTGPAGVAAVVLVLAVKLAALVSLVGEAAWSVLIAVPLLGRTGAVWLFLTSPYVHAEGLGAQVAQHLPRTAAWIAMAVGVVLALYIGGMTVFAALVAGVIALIFVQWLMDRHVGGITGDTIGAAIEVTEAVMLLVAVFADTVQG